MPPRNFPDLDWAAILPLNGSKQDGFEELCTQLARSSCPPGFEFVRKGRPDSGVEAFAVDPQGGEWAWQAKYFDSIKASQWAQLDESVKAALVGHPKLTRYVACIPLDLADGRSRGAISARQQWINRKSKWSQWAAKRGMVVEFVWQGSHELLEQLARPENEGCLHFFFGGRNLDQSWFDARLSEAIKAAGPRYTPELNVDLDINENFEALGRTREFFDVAQRANCKAFFIMDAINEGAGRLIWPTHLAPFLDRLAAGKHLRLYPIGDGADAGCIHRPHGRAVYGGHRALGNVGVVQVREIVDHPYGGGWSPGEHADQRLRCMVAEEAIR